MPQNQHVFIWSQNNENNFWIEKFKSADWNQQKQIMAYHA